MACWRDIAGDHHLLLGGLELQGTHHPLHHFLHRHHLQLQVDAGIDPTKVEQAGHQLGHAVHTGEDLAHIACLLLVQLTDHLQHGGIAAHGGQRIAQVMADGGDKLRFEGIQLFEAGDVAQDAYPAHRLTLDDNRGGGGQVDLAIRQLHLGGLFFLRDDLQQLQQGRVAG